MALNVTTAYAEESEPREPASSGPLRASFSDRRWVRLMERLAELERRVDDLDGGVTDASRSRRSAR